MVDMRVSKTRAGNGMRVRISPPAQMIQTIIPYIVTLMIFYDLSIHAVYLFGFEKFLLKRKINFWPELNGKKYQIFWTTYWGIAFILAFLYIFTR